jgi:hypothetical protein
MVNEANLIYAAMAKRAMQENNDGFAARGFPAACDSLNNGEHAKAGAHWLGVDAHVRAIHPSQLNSVPFAVGSSDRHVVFAGNGATDHYGRPVRTNGTDTNGNGLRWAYTLV